MAWIEQRRRRFVVYTRMDGAKAKGPSYAARADAELFVTLAERFGWQAAQDYVAGQDETVAAAPATRTVRERAVAAGAIDDPAALPASDPGLLAPPGREPSGVSVGELVRRHIDAGTARTGPTSAITSTRSSATWTRPTSSGSPIRSPRAPAPRTSSPGAPGWQRSPS
jgi:hypothetical protein